MKSAYADEIPCGDEISLDGGWVDLISSEAKPKISSKQSKDFTVQFTISLNIRVAFLFYEPKTKGRSVACPLFLVFLFGFSIDKNQS